MILLHETGRISETEIVPAAGNALAPGTMPVDENPLGKVPTLFTDDGQALFDGRVICRWLDAQTGAGFYPEGPSGWRSLVLEAIADGICEAGVLIVYEGRLRAEAMRSAAWVEGQWCKIARTLDSLERQAMDHLEVGFDIAHVAAAAALGHLDFRHPARNWRHGHPRLAAFADDLAGRPSLHLTEPRDQV